MSTKKLKWKVWLRPNLLTQDVDNDYIAEVSTVGSTLRNEDIARLIVAERSEIKYDTILSILNQGDRIKREKLAGGSSVLDGVGHYTPRVHGNWIGANSKYDPEKHTITVSLSQSKELREILKTVGLEVLGAKESGAYIGRVVDLDAGMIDDNVSPGYAISIEGDKIRVSTEGEDGIGVFFVPENGGAPVHVKHRLLTNDPKKVVAMVPQEVKDGKYRLRIVTRYTNSHTELKEARTIEYERLLGIRGSSGSGGDGGNGGGGDGGGKGPGVIDELEVLPEQKNDDANDKKETDSAQSGEGQQN